MAQNPAQANVVSSQQALEGRFRKVVEPAVTFSVASEKQRAHHRRGRQRNQQRDAHRNTQRDRKFAEQPAHDPAHQQNGDEHRDQRSAHGHNRKTDLPRALHRRGERFHSRLQVPSDVFDDHDGVVHHETRGNRERHQREIVQAVPAEIHHAECADQ